MELVSMVNQKIAKWEERSLQGAASLGKDFRTLVLNFSSNLAMGHPAKAENHQPPPSKHNGYAEAAGASPGAPKALPKAPKPPYKSPLPEKPPRIFLRLPEDHPACRASPHATMDILRKHLDKTCSTVVKEIQQVPSGLAIWPRDGLGLHLLTERKEALENCIQGAKAEVEQNWAILRFFFFMNPTQTLSIQQDYSQQNEQILLGLGAAFLLAKGLTQSTDSSPPRVSPIEISSSSGKTLQSNSSMQELQRSAKPASPICILSSILGPTTKTLVQKSSADKWALVHNMRA